jgi:hypothetical protein
LVVAGFILARNTAGYALPKQPFRERVGVKGAFSEQYSFEIRKGFLPYSPTEQQMGFLPKILAIVGALFLGIIFLLEVGRHIRLARMEREGDAGKGVGAVEGAVYGLLGLLIAFTFSGAATRYDSRRLLIVEEANAIGTAYLRLDLLPAEARD